MTPVVSRGVVPVVFGQPHDVGVASDECTMQAEWSKYDGGVYRCEVRLHPETHGGFSAYVPELPGVVSEGNTEREALDNIREALAAAIESYRAENQDIPWDKTERPSESNDIERWVTVNA